MKPAMNPSDIGGTKDVLFSLSDLVEDLEVQGSDTSMNQWMVLLPIFLTVYFSLQGPKTETKYQMDDFCTISYDF